LAPGGRRADPPPSGRGRRVSAHLRLGSAARARRPRVPHHVLHGAVPPGDAAPRPRRNRADLAVRGSDRSIRKRPGKGKRERGKVVKQYSRSEEHTSELQSRSDLVCRLLLEKKKKKEDEITK